NSLNCFIKLNVRVATASGWLERLVRPLSVTTSILLKIKVPFSTERFKVDFCFIAGFTHFTIVQRIAAWLKSRVGICVALSRATDRKTLRLYNQVDGVSVIPRSENASFYSERAKKMAIFIPSLWCEPEFRIWTRPSDTTGRPSKVERDPH